MKKSTLMVTLAVAGVFITLTAANLKLKSEYEKGAIKSALVPEDLASFHYIKTPADSTTVDFVSFEINVDRKNKSSVSRYYYDERHMNFKVVNDTLFIRNEPGDNTRRMSTVVINTPYLKNIDVMKGRYIIKQAESDSLAVTAGGESSVTMEMGKLNSIRINSMGKSKVVLSATAIINEGWIEVKDRSSFHAKNIVIADKKISVGDSCSILLSGRSVKDFKVADQVRL